MPAALTLNGHVHVDGTGGVPLKWVEVNASAIGDNTIIAAVSGKKLRVLLVDLRAGVALTLTVKSGNNTKISATALVATERLSLNAHPGFWVETNVGEALIFNQSLGGVQGILNYIEVN